MKLVKCIDNTGAEAILKLGQIYEVISERPTGSVSQPVCPMYTIKGLESYGEFWSSRFEEVKPSTKPAKRVLCIEDYQVQNYLTKGYLYEVEEEITDDKGQLLYKLKGVTPTWKHQGFIAKRFEVVEDTESLLEEIDAGWPEPSSDSAIDWDVYNGFKKKR